MEVPVGTEIDVRLQAPLNSGTSQVEDRFEATTLVDVGVNGRVVVPAGSLMRGVVTAVEPATRTNRTARLTISFDQVTVNGQPYPIRGTVTEAIEGSGIKGEAARIGTGAGVGAIIGGILGGVKGALAGILIGGGGTIAATEGKEVRDAAGIGAARSSRLASRRSRGGADSDADLDRRVWTASRPSALRARLSSRRVRR